MQDINLSKAEKIKEESNYLAGEIAEQLQNASSFFDENEVQLLKFHGTYQQFNRDTATELKRVGKEKEFFFIADGNCKMTESLGMVLDCSGFGMGKRSQRYVMLVENKIIKKLIVEKDPGVCSLTNADSILNSI